MTERKPRKPVHVARDDWDAIDSPPLSEVMLAKMRPVSEVAPELIAQQRRRGRPKLEAPKQAVKIRLSQDVLAGFRATGPGWQTRINDALRQWLKRRRSHEIARRDP